MTEKQHIFDYTQTELIETCKALGLAGFRAKQILEWVYTKFVSDPATMTNLSQKDRALISEHFSFEHGKIIRHQLATDGTQKLLIDWSLESHADENTTDTNPLQVLGQESPESQTECVMIPSQNQSGTVRKTACISSQMGCPVGCKFCASGISGLDGNLTAGQIVQQVWQLSRLPEVERISNIVFMGMGEPLANFNAVLKAIKIINAPWGMGVGARKITVSTVGLPAQIKRLAKLELPVTLAISLHAPNDEIRRELIPWAEYVTIAQLLDAAHEYFEVSGREITLEYILLGGVNDQPEHARELAKLAKQIRCNINLIRYNEVKGMPYTRPMDQDVLDFQQILAATGINTHIRASRGRDIAAACGQLRHEHAKS
ncbi:23S rRNA (adenine(2503)-C(2))-methyltransferase RlmN [Poriferisphaera sp. WC338]|uniref:23S rRNA (adenine(2503)-C(2))-methyltransferase RlmN n=1 Tax=Poriferisphaera sp. WC338 TaxID=3425129 RepID=UPI003D8191D1